MTKGYKTGGRVAGTPNRRTVDRQALLAACATDDPEDFLRAIMVSPSPLIDMRMRIDAAKALLTARRWGREEKLDPKLVEDCYSPATDPLLQPRVPPIAPDRTTGQK
jgi:hypothetical protein